MGLPKKKVNLFIKNSKKMIGIMSSKTWVLILE